MFRCKQCGCEIYKGDICVECYEANKSMVSNRKIPHLISDPSNEK